MNSMDAICHGTDAIFSISALSPTALAAIHTAAIFLPVVLILLAEWRKIDGRWAAENSGDFCDFCDFQGQETAGKP